MKTAMQELLQILESKILPCDDDNSYVYGMNVAHANLIYNIKNGFLEKEKEQIIDFHVMLMKKGLEQEGNKIEWDYDELKKEAEEYYNQTYNQEETLEE